jgi:hypothetical protein
VGQYLAIADQLTTVNAILVNLQHKLYQLAKDTAIKALKLVFDQKSKFEADLKKHLEMQILQEEDAKLTKIQKSLDATDVFPYDFQQIRPNVFMIWKQ